MEANQPSDGTQPSSSSSSSYDVFISYFSEDAESSLFAANLRKALTDGRINTFADDNKRSKDNEIAPELSKVINESKIAIIVFSENYATSSFCLEALSYIVDNFDHSGRLILPIFYDIAPSQVRRQSGPYGEAFTKHEERLKENRDVVIKWRRVLTQVASFTGWNINHGDGNEFNIINNIVEQVSRRFDRIPLQNAISHAIPDVSPTSQSTPDVSQTSQSTPDDSQVIQQISHTVFQAETTWRLVGLMSSVLGLLCYALSPSFNRLYGRWKPFKFFLYGSLSLAIFTTILFARKTTISTQQVQLKTFTSFAVLLIISVYSFFYDKAVNGKPEILSVVSNAAFALVSLSVHKLINFGFEIGVFSYFLGCFTVQLFTINRMLILIAIFFGGLLFAMDSSLNSRLEVASGSQVIHSSSNPILAVDGGGQHIVGIDS